MLSGAEADSVDMIAMSHVEELEKERGCDSVRLTLSERGRQISRLVRHLFSKI